MKIEDTLAGLSTLGFSAFGLLLLMLTVLSLSAYVKIATVLGILRAGLGVWGLPSVLVTGSLSVILSFFVMYPTLVNSLTAANSAIGANHSANQDQLRVIALNAGFEKWKEFLKAHAHPGEIEDFAAAAQKIDSVKGQQPNAQNTLNINDSKDSWRVLAPAFFISELKDAFSTGLKLFLPLLVVDLIVINVLTALGYLSLNPILVGLPFKLLLFVMLDGWSLIATNLVSSYAG